MAQRPIILGLGPRLKGNFVAIFEVIKALQFRCFLHFTFILHIIGTSTTQILHWICKFGNLKKRKGIRLGPLFSNQISLVTLRSLFPISGQTKFLIPSPVYILPCTLYNPITYLLIKNDNIHNYIHTFEYFERKDKIGLLSWLKPSKNRTFSHGSNTKKTGL